MSGVRGRLKCRERDLFASVAVLDAVDKPAVETSSANQGKIAVRFLNHFIVEFIASVILMYSSVYVPEDGNDFMKQYVSSIAIFIVILAVKDKAYFCPDGTPMTTAVLAASGAYTDINKRTDWVDICVRVSGQLVGWAVVCFCIVGFNKEIFAFSVPEYKHNVGGAKMQVWFTVFNELIATFVECVAISYMIMPLLNSYADVDSPPGFQSKQEAMPPNNNDLGFASASIAMLHYVLERLFRTTMNPFVYIMYRHITNFDDAALIVTIVVAQSLALGLACTYCYFLLPSQRVFDHIRSTSAGKTK
jgi:glycerol uptake facilitator-like aquaporin